MRRPLIRSKWQPALIVAIAFSWGAWSSHRAVLECLASPLVVDDPTNAIPYVALLAWNHRPDGNGCYDAAVELRSRTSGGQILVVEPRRDRLVQMGILPSFEALTRRELAARGIPEYAVSVVQSQGLDDWATAHALQIWLRQRPNASVALLCAAFRSARLRYVLNVVIEPAQAMQVQVYALADPRCHTNNWWTSRRGIKVFAMAWLRLLHAWCIGDSGHPPPCGNADDYEKRFLQPYAEADA